MEARAEAVRIEDRIDSALAMQVAHKPAREQCPQAAAQIEGQCHHLHSSFTTTPCTAASTFLGEYGLSNPSMFAEGTHEVRTYSPIVRKCAGGSRSFGPRPD